MRDLFNADLPEIQINKPIRLLEFFAGMGTQLQALKRIGADVESWFVCEFDQYAIKAYNAVHGTNYKTIDIKTVKGGDLKIQEKNKYCYMLTYSFP